MAKPSIFDWIDKLYPILSDWKKWQEVAPAFAQAVESSPNRSLVQRVAMSSPSPMPFSKFSGDLKSGMGEFDYANSGSLSLSPTTFQSAITNPIGSDVQGMQSLGVLGHELGHAVQFGPNGMRLPQDLFRTDLFVELPDTDIARIQREFPAASVPQVDRSWIDDSHAYKQYRQARKTESDEFSRWLQNGGPAPWWTTDTINAPLRRLHAGNIGAEDLGGAIEREARLYESGAQKLPQTLAEFEATPAQIKRYLIPSLAASSLPFMFDEPDTQGF